MAKKKTIIEETVPDGTGADGLPIEMGSVSWDTDTDELLTKIKAQYGGSLTKIKVYKIMPGKSQPVFCFSSEENVDEETLQESHGGGRYALRFFVDNILKHTEQIEVADKPKPANSNGNGTGSAMDVQNQMLRDQLAWNQQMILAMLGRQTPMTPPTPMGDIVQAWTMLQGGNGNGGGSFEKMIDLFTKGMEIGASKGGDMDWKSTLIHAAKEIAPSLMQVAAAAKGATIQANPIAPPPPMAMLPDQVLKDGIGFMKAKILAGLPVGLALDWIVANSAEYQQFLSIAMSKSFEDIVKVDNEIANEPFNSWFRELLKGLKEHFKDATVIDSETEEGE